MWCQARHLPRPHWLNTCFCIIGLHVGLCARPHIGPWSIGRHPSRARELSCGQTDTHTRAQTRTETVTLKTIPTVTGVLFFRFQSARGQ